MLSSSQSKLAPVAPNPTSGSITTVSLITKCPSSTLSTFNPHLISSPSTNVLNSLTNSPSVLNIENDTIPSSILSTCAESRVNSSILPKNNISAKETKHRTTSKKNNSKNYSNVKTTPPLKDSLLNINIPDSSECLTLSHSSSKSIPSYSPKKKDPPTELNLLQSNLKHPFDPLNAFSLEDSNVTSGNSICATFNKLYRDLDDDNSHSAQLGIDHSLQFEPINEIKKNALSEYSCMEFGEDSVGMKSFLPCWFHEISEHQFTSPFSTISTFSSPMSTDFMNLEILEKFPCTHNTENWISSLPADSESIVPSTVSITTLEENTLKSSLSKSVKPKFFKSYVMSKKSGINTLPESLDVPNLDSTEPLMDSSTTHNSTLSEEAMLMDTLKSYIHSSPELSNKSNTANEAYLNSGDFSSDVEVKPPSLNSNATPRLSSRIQTADIKTKLSQSPALSLDVKNVTSDLPQESTWKHSNTTDNAPLRPKSAPYHSVNPPPPFLPYVIPCTSSAFTLQYPSITSVTSEPTISLSASPERILQPPTFSILSHPPLTYYPPPPTPFTPHDKHIKQACFPIPSASFPTTCKIESSTESNSTFKTMAATNSSSSSLSTLDTRRTTNSTSVKKRKPATVSPGMPQEAKAKHPEPKASEDTASREKQKRCKQESGLRKFKQKRSERRFSCQICEQCFKRSEHLKRHLRIHTGERPFLCPVDGCLKSFSRTDNLTQHLKIHSKPELRSTTQPPSEPIYPFPTFVPPGMVLSWIPVLSPAPLPYGNVSLNISPDPTFHYHLEKSGEAT